MKTVTFAISLVTHSLRATLCWCAQLVHKLFEPNELLSRLSNRYVRKTKYITFLHKELYDLSEIWYGRNYIH